MSKKTAQKQDQPKQVQAKPIGKAPLRSSLKNMIIVLGTICTLSALLLSITYVGTKDLIDSTEKQKQIDAIASVLPGANNDALEERIFIAADPDLIVFPLKQNGALLGFAVQTYSDQAYAKRITMIVGIDVKGALTGVKVLSHAETPGLGSKISSKGFQKQFINQETENFVVKVKQDGGQVDAIAAATISSRAFCDALQRALDGLKRIKAEQVEALRQQSEVHE